MGLFIKQSEGGGGGSRDNEDFRNTYDFMYVLVSFESNSPPFKSTEFCKFE